MKKIFSYLFLVLLALGLVACGKDKTPTDKPNDKPGDKTCAEDPNQDKCKQQEDICETNPWAGENCNFDLGAMTFTIMDNAPTTGDPRNANYSGTNQEIKAAKYREVEAKYNIKIKFVGYTAAWGDGRDNFIIQSAATGNPAAMVFNISSSSVAPLATAGAIQALDSYIEKYAPDTVSDFNRNYGKFLGKNYAYSDKTPLNNSLILYNNTMLKNLGYEDEYPSKLWNQGQWTWSTYEALVKELNDKMTKGEEYVMGGRPSNWAFGMIGAAGGSLIDTNCQVQLDSEAVMKTMEFLSGLYDIDGGPLLSYQDDVQVTTGVDGRTWAMDSDYSDTLQTQFKNGKVVFENGETWFCGSDAKLGKADFEIGAVPYPISADTYVEGGRQLADGTTVYYNEDYVSLGAWGGNTYVISSGFSDVPEGYEAYYLSDEAIFRIWNELQYFEEDQEYLENYATDFYENYYCGPESVQAHKSVALASKSDYLFSLGGTANSLALSDSIVSYLQYMVVNPKDGVRSSLTTLSYQTRQLVVDKFGVAQNGDMGPDPEEPTEE